ncbi:hypothetical protein BROSI_B0021 [Candidatus Brocadia sinica JPN1]|uniref:Uncharacterized protein n=1 Tax=Candidatus Brocadia sinica JPN1 TaxID=1197129 RepID=A0ABQ0K3G1_9BACT|nr:hypothetical protein BROSI_B0021 [Candidatus Brocadia sinica JPN1]
MAFQIISFEVNNFFTAGLGITTLIHYLKNTWKVTSGNK